MTADADYLWLVAAVESGSEIDVADDIAEAYGFAIFVPVERVWGMVRGRRVAKQRPLFMGYTFFGIVPGRHDWQRVFDVEGVIDVLCQPVEVCGRYVSHIRPEWITAVQKMQECGVFDRTSPLPDRFKVGELVRIDAGPLAGLNATIQTFVAKMRSATARKRAKLLVQFMGRMSTIEMDVTALEKL